MKTSEEPSNPSPSRQEAGLLPLGRPQPFAHPAQLVSSKQALAWILACVSGGSMRLMALKAASKNPGARVTTRCASVSGYMSPVMLSVGSSRSFTLAMSLYTFRGSE